MKAIRFHEYGGPEVLSYEDVALPVPAAGQVRIRVAGTTFNNVEGNIRAGLMQGPMPMTLPHTPGLDVSGTVDEVGGGVEGLEVGDEVVGFLPFADDGAAAEYVLVAADALAAAPRTIDLSDAAAFPLVGLTAWQALFDHADLKPGQRVLVNGAEGPVGGYAVQLAAASGAHVIATASERGRDRVLAQGADEIIDHTSTPLRDAVTERVDVLLNFAPIDPELFATLTELVADGGVIVNSTVWMPAPSDADRGVRGIDLYVRNDRTQLAELVAMIDDGRVTVDITRRVPLSDLASVHEDAAAGTLSGKVVVVPGRLAHE